MPKILNFKVEKIQVQMSKKSYDFIRSKKSDKREPFYMTHDRLISNFKLDKMELANMLDKFRNINQFYLNRIHELENEIKIIKSNGYQKELQ